MKKGYLATFLFFVSIVFISSCKKDSDDTVVIPEDPGTPVPSTNVNNLSNSISNPAIKDEGNGVISITLLGISDPKVGDNFINFSGTGSNQNIWIEEDGVNKGIVVEKVNRSKSGKNYTVDAVFIVDNSGSMYDEADSIASQITSFANFLSSNGIDLRVGCVGHNGEVNGALNITTVDKMKQFLDLSTGTGRTEGFGGLDASTLENNAYTFCSSYSGSENAIPSLLFADKYFSWRPDASRFFINFTDEALQPGSTLFDLAQFKNEWNYTKGIVNSVFSLEDSYWNGSIPDTTMDHENYTDWNLTNSVRPWELAKYTGGAQMFIHSDCADLNLKNLEATVQLSESFVIKFKTSANGNSHTLKIVVKNSNGTSDGFKIFNGVTYQ